MYRYLDPLCPYIVQMVSTQDPSWSKFRQEVGIHQQVFHKKGHGLVYGAYMLHRHLEQLIDIAICVCV